MAEIHHMPNYIAPKPPPKRIGYPTLDLVLDVAADAFEVPRKVLIGTSGAHPLPRYRFAIWAAMIEACHAGQTSVASYFARSYSSIQNGLRVVDTDPELQAWTMFLVTEARQRWVA